MFTPHVNQERLVCRPVNIHLALRLNVRRREKDDVRDEQSVGDVVAIHQAALGFLRRTQRRGTTDHGSIPRRPPLTARRRPPRRFVVEMNVYSASGPEWWCR